MPYPDNMPLEGGPYPRERPPLAPRDAERVETLLRISDDATRLWDRVESLDPGDLCQEHGCELMALSAAAHLRALRIEADSERR